MSFSPALPQLALTLQEKIIFSQYNERQSSSFLCIQRYDEVTVQCDLYEGSDLKINLKNCEMINSHLTFKMTCLYSFIFSCQVLDNKHQIKRGKKLE